MTVMLNLVVFMYCALFCVINSAATCVGQDTFVKEILNLMSF